jgi:Ca-activated chloride channel family protein
MTNKKLIETFTEKPKLIAATEQTVDVLVRITPPEADTNEIKRPKLNIGIALDRSGSMSGEKMHEAREAAKYCVDQMLPSDIFSTVIFDDHVDVLFTSQPVTDREMFKRGIDRIHARNSTALHEGWVKAGLEVSEHLDANAINRVLLITDGQANVGETNPSRIVEQARQVAAKGVSTSTIGIGRDFNEDLLMPMAEAAGGNAWHVQEPDDMVRIFETELRGLIRQFAHSVTLSIKPAAGVKVVDVLNDFEKDAGGHLILPNLLAGSPLDIVVRFSVPATAAGETVEICDFELAYTGQATQAIKKNALAVALAADSAEVVAGLPSDAGVVQAVQLLMNARARREAMEHLDRGEFGAAVGTLKSYAAATSVLASRAPSAALDAELKDLEEIQFSLLSREEDDMSRKKMAYRREATRKGR